MSSVGEGSFAMIDLNERATKWTSVSFIHLDVTQLDVVMPAVSESLPSARHFYQDRYARVTEAYKAKVHLYGQSESSDQV